MIEPNIIKLPARLNIKFQDISKDNVLAKIAQETQTMAPSYEQNKARIGEIHGTVNLGFKRPVHEGYTLSLCYVPPLPSCVALLFSCLSRPLVLPFLFFGRGITCMMVAARTMTFAGMLCYYVCGCV